tara:strand:- start:655 stop:906 length:252 start_codon:yes stop_codon:yes gene_type:complete
MTLFEIYSAAKENADLWDPIDYDVATYVKTYADSVFEVQLSDEHCELVAKAFLDAEDIFNNETEWTLQLFNRIEEPLRSIEID